MSTALQNGMNNSNNDAIHYPTLIPKSNNPFVMFNETQLPNYTNPPDQKPIMPGTYPLIINNPQTDYVNKNNISNNTGTASSISTAFNIMKGIMGVGVLTLSWSIANIGLIPALILLSVSFLLSYVSWIFLCLLSEKYNVYTYRDIGLILFGKDFATALDIILLIFCYLLCIVYVTFLSQFVTVGLAQFHIHIDDSINFSNLHLITSFKQFLSTKFFVLTVSILCILWPLSLLPKLDSLKYSSFVGMIGCFYIIGLVVFAFFDNDHSINNTVVNVNYHNQTRDSADEHKFFWFWLASFSIFVACFNTHFNGPALYGELRNKTPIKFINVSSVSFFLVLFLNLVIGIFGYFTFGSDASENILNALNNDIVVSVAQLIMTLSIIGTYPLLFWNIKVSINNLFLYRNVTNVEHSKVKKVPRQYTCLCSKLLLYFVVTFTIWIIAIVAVDVAVILSFLQSLLGNAIVFIIPSVLYLQMLKKEHLKGERESKCNTKLFLMTVLCYIVVAFGVVCVIGGCTASVMFWAGYIQ